MLFYISAPRTAHAVAGFANGVDRCSSMALAPVSTASRAEEAGLGKLTGRDGWLRRVMAAQFEFRRSAPPDVVAARAGILPGESVSAGISAAM